MKRIFTFACLALATFALTGCAMTYEEAVPQYQMAATKSLNKQQMRHIKSRVTAPPCQTCGYRY